LKEKNPYQKDLAQEGAKSTRGRDATSRGKERPKGRKRAGPVVKKGVAVVETAPKSHERKATRPCFKAGRQYCRPGRGKEFRCYHGMTG